MATLRPEIDRRQPRAAPLQRISWGAALGGAALGLTVLLALSALGITAGLLDVRPMRAAGVGIAAGIWWVLSGFVAMFVGGACTARLAGLRRSMEGPLHALIAWAVASLILAATASTLAGALVAGGFRASLSGATRRASEAPAVIERSPQNPAGTRRKPRDVGETSGAGWSFLFLLAGGLGAAAGGAVGVPRPRKEGAGTSPSKAAAEKKAAGPAPSADS